MKFLRFISAVIAFVTAVLLVCTSCISLAVFSVRSAVTNELVYNTFADVDYSSVNIPDGEGGYTSITSVINSSLEPVGISMSNDEVRDALDAFGVDIIVSSFAQEVRDWFFDDAPTPTLDPYKISAIVMDTLPQTVLSLMSLVGDPEEILPEMLSAYTDMVDIDALTSSLEPYKVFVSQSMLLISFSAAVGLCIFLLLVLRMHYGKWLVVSGTSLAVSAVGAIVAAVLLSREFYDTGVFAPIVTAVTSSVANCGKLMFVSSVAVAVVAGVVWKMFSLVKNAKQPIPQTVQPSPEIANDFIPESTPEQNDSDENQNSENNTPSNTEL